MGLPKQNYTQVPNVLIDDWLKDLSPRAYIVFTVICRYSIGWHTDTCFLSQKQIAKITGYSKNTIISATKELEQKKIITTKREVIDTQKVSRGGKEWHIAVHKRGTAIVYEPNFDAPLMGSENEPIMMGAKYEPKMLDTGSKSEPESQFMGSKSEPLKYKSLNKENKPEKNNKKISDYSLKFLDSYKHLTGNDITEIPFSTLKKAENGWAAAGRSFEQWVDFVDWLFAEDWFKSDPSRAYHLGRAEVINQWAASKQKKPDSRPWHTQVHHAKADVYELEKMAERGEVERARGLWDKQKMDEVCAKYNIPGKRP